MIQLRGAFVIDSIIDGGILAILLCIIRPQDSSSSKLFNESSSIEPLRGSNAQGLSLRVL